MRVDKICYNLLFFIVLLCPFLCINFVNAEEELKICTKSEAFKEWEKLSDLQKQTAIMPPYCEKENDGISNVVLKFKDNFNVIYDAKSLPSRFDIRDKSYRTGIRDQKSTGACWAFSVTTGLEIFADIKLGKDDVYSPRHIEYASTRKFKDEFMNEFGYNRNVGDGGNFYMSSSYLANGVGPIPESEMPFEDNEEPINISEIKNKTQLLDVNNIVLNYGIEGDACTTREISDIKNYIYNNGSVMTTVYMNEYPMYFNSNTSAAYYNGKEQINHAVLIVGWDDNYSKNNFSASNRPSKDGAWIVQNSYGTDFGDDGYFYVSYQDVRVCDFIMVIDGVDEEIEDNKYIYDTLGYLSQMGYEVNEEAYNEAYIMNVFNKSVSGSELLKEVTFGTTGTGRYEIYYYPNRGNNVTVNDMTLVGQGDIGYSGYVTHKFENPILIDQSIKRFSVVVRYIMDTTTMPIPLMSNKHPKYIYADVGNSRSYSSAFGTTWYDLSQKNSVASLKAFTDNVGYSLKLTDAKSSKESSSYKVNIGATHSGIEVSKLSVVVKNSKGMNQTVSNLSLNSSNITFNLSGNTLDGIYTAKVSYDGNLIENLSFVVGDILVSDVFAIDQNNWIVYVQPNTSQKQFASGVYGLKDTTFTSSGSLVKTGNKADKYTIVVMGDVNGDGLARMNDVMIISKYTVEGTGLEYKYNMLAADVNKDGSVKMNDVMKISAYTVIGGTL